MKYIEACDQKTWHIEIWNEDDPASVKRVPYRCGSWRHIGECRRRKGAQDFCRVAAALLSKRHWTYLVLTFDQSKWKRKTDQYRKGLHCWAALRKRIIRLWGDIKYVQTWERHLKGGCHLNLVISSRFLADEIERIGWRTVRQVVKRQAVACGFGPVIWLEPIRGDTEKDLAWYCCKLSGELTSAAAKSQVPFDAPAHFRRLRASRGLLPPIEKSGKCGKIRFCSVASMATQLVEKSTDS